MRAVGFTRSLPIDDPESLIDLTLDRPVPTGRDLLVEVKAVSVNPVDTKVRKRTETTGKPVVLGYDAAGVVAAAGPDVTLFRPGDEVFYAGSIARPGTNSEFHLVDERIVGRKPKRLGFAAAAALPLTAITAWEMMFDRLGIPRSRDGRDAGPALLLIGSAGGVGSIAIQLARALTDVTVIGTASRPETAGWARSLGAHHVIDHTEPMAPQLAAIGHATVPYIFSTTSTDQHFDAIAEVIAPQGKLGLIDDPGPIDVRKLKRKCASLHWELMFTRPLFGTPDMIEQHRLLNAVADLVDAGRIETTATETLGRIDAATLRRAHALIESGRTRGKLVLEGF